MRPGVRALPIVRTPAPHGAAERLLGVVDPAGGCMVSVVTKTRDRGRTARATTAGKGAEAWGLPLRNLRGFFMGAIWQF